jgi:hypothetical protein
MELLSFKNIHFAATLRTGYSDIIYQSYN